MNHDRDGHSPEHPDGIADPQPDAELGELLRRAVEVPARDPAFDERLRAGLERADDGVDRGESRERARTERGGRASRLRRGLARRSWTIAFGAAAAAAAAALALTLTGVPGLPQSSPAPATAAERLVADIDAGLARVKTLQGAFIVDDRTPADPLNTNPQPVRATFAVTAAGDRYFDISLRCNRAAAVQAWRKQLKALGPNWQSAESGGQAWSAKALENAETALLQLRSITPREIWACDAGTPGLSQPVKREYVDALTGKTLGWSYRDYEGVGVGVFASPAGAAQVWSLSTQLRIELAQHDPEVTVAPATYEGRPVQKATIRNSAGAPVYVAYVDDRYGVTLALARVGAAAPDHRLTPFHLADLKVNETIAPSRFTVKPDYSLDPDSPPQRARPNVARSLYVTDFGGRVYPATELDRLASPATLVPSWVPAGYRLDSVFGAPGQELALVYRRGLLQLIVDSFGRDYLLKHRALAFDRTDWPTLESDQLVEMGRGPLAGWPAAVNKNPARAAALSGVYFDVAGDLAPSDLQRVAESLHPATGSYPAPTEHKTAAAVVLVAGTALAAVVALLWVARLRRKALRRPSIKGIGWLPLIGAAVVVLGAGLHWHAMLGYGHNATFAVTGWREPLALATVGVALAAAAAAACLPLAARRLSGALRATAIALASLAVAAAVLGVFYLPVQARFVVQTAPQLGDFFDRYFANPASPSAGPGLYVSILGCVVLLIGAILAGRSRADGETT